MPRDERSAYLRHNFGMLSTLERSTATSIHQYKMKAKAEAAVSKKLALEQRQARYEAESAFREAQRLVNEASDAQLAASDDLRKPQLRRLMGELCCARFREARAQRH